MKGLTLRTVALNVRSYRHKKTEGWATAARFHVDVQALTETLSRPQGLVEGEEYDLWKSGAEGAGGKALLIHHGGHFRPIPPVWPLCQTMVFPGDGGEGVFEVHVSLSCAQGTPGLYRASQVGLHSLPY